MSTSWRCLAMSMATRVAGAGVGLSSVMVGRPPACVQRHHCETCWLAMTTPRSAAAQPGPAPPRCFPMCYGSEFVNNRLIDYCLGHGIELTRSRPYRKNDQAWIEQKNGAVVRKLVGYRRFEGLAAARAIGRLYAASRLFVNFFQPSFKLAAKQRDGAKVTKRYHPPQTPCERLLQAEGVPMAVVGKLREIAAGLDPLKLLEEMRAVQAYLAALATGKHRHRRQPSRLTWRRSWRACPAPGTRARSVRPSRSKPNRVTCEASKRSQHQSWLRDRPPRSSWRAHP